MTPRLLPLALLSLLLGLTTTLAQTASPPASAPASTRTLETQRLDSTGWAVASTSAPDPLPKSNFYGTGGHATRIVYIIDHSGSMLDNFDFLREELKRSIGNLLPLQSFNVVMVSEETHTVMPAGRLALATAEAKKEFISKIAEYRAQGQNDELLEPFQQAFEEAFKTKPQLIYFLTDGKLDPKVLAVVAKLNKDHKVIINTLAFINKEPDYESQLQKLAKDNGGTYRFVSARDLGR